MQHFFTIIGGMGTLATEAYIHLLNQDTPAQKDQDYLNYVLLNHATIPDRTSYILHPKKYPNPLPSLVNDIKQQNQFHPEFYVIPCNTAHYFYKKLQSIANAPILNMPNEAINSIQHSYPTAKRIGLIATRGTLRDKIYNRVIINHGYQLELPSKQIEEQVMDLIYNHVKAHGDPDKKLYQQIINEMINQFDCDVIVLGCTELSYAQEKNKLNVPVIDAQAVLAKHSVKLAKKLQ